MIRAAAALALAAGLVAAGPAFGAEPDEPPVARTSTAAALAEAVPRATTSTRTRTRARARPPRRKGGTYEVLPGAMQRPTGIPEGRGLWFGTPDRQFIFRLSGFAHLDSRMSVAPEPSIAVLPRRVRFAPEGVLFGQLDYRLLIDVAIEAMPIDAYLDWRAMPELNLRVGRFKSPFGFERRARAFALWFIERGFPTQLAPNRDIGAFVHGQTVDGFFSYDVAILSGSGDLESITGLRGTPEWAGRVYFQPFRLLDQPLFRHLGAGFSWTLGSEEGSEDAARLGRLTTTARNQFFRYRAGEDEGPVAFADGARRRWSVHGHWRHERVKALAEYVLSSQRVRAGESLRTLAHQAWQLAASMTLTDDENGFFGVNPRRPLDPSLDQWGAFSVAARYHGIRLDPGTFPLFADPSRSARGAHAGTLCFQWHMNGLLELVAETEAVVFLSRPGELERPAELSFSLRLEARY